MNLKENNLLESSEITYVTFGVMLGHGIFTLPNELAKHAYEAAWISAIIGSIYPFYLCALAIFISKNHPKENILVLSKKYFGKTLGSIINFLFLIHFVIGISFVISGFSNIYYIYFVNFLTPVKIMSIFILLVSISAYRGLKTLARINLITFFLSSILLLLTLSALIKGSYLNLLPISDVSFMNVLKASKESFYMYGGVEMLFLIYPSFKEPQNMTKPVLRAAGLITFFYTYATIITIYYLGPDVILKSEWSLILVSESLNLTIINNFRYVFELLWISISGNVISNFYYSCSVIAKDLFYKISRKSIFISLYIIITFVATRMPEVTLRKKIIDMLYEKMVVFVIIYTSSIALFVLCNKDVEKV